MPKIGIDNEAKKLLIEVVGNLKNKNETEQFINDLFSSAEVKDLSRRLLAAKMLMKEKTYLDISQDLGMSEGTINKIHFKTKGSPLIRSLFK